MKKNNFILLVDDDDINNYLTQRLLSRLNPGAEVKIAKNGEEALQIIEEISESEHICPDLILLDINMPVMNGIEFMDRFSHSDLRPKCKVVAVTTSNNKKDFVALRNLGIEDIILKPLTQSTMAEILTLQA